MDNDKLIEQLSNELKQTLNCSIIETKMVSIPFHSFDVTYYPIIKKRMDILMKMLLTAAKTNGFKDAVELSDVLHVETLFINDLLSQMKRSHLIEQEDMIALTAKGEKQLAEGVYEEQLDLETSILLYSPVHEAYFSEDVEDLLEFEEELELVLEESSLQIVDEAICEKLQDEKREQDPSIHVLAYEEIVEKQIYDLPFLVFICYEQKGERYFMRVHNYVTNEWDEVAERFLQKEKLAEWRPKN